MQPSQLLSLPSQMASLEAGVEPAGHMYWQPTPVLMLPAVESRGPEVTSQVGLAALESVGAEAVVAPAAAVLELFCLWLFCFRHVFSEFSPAQQASAS